MRLALLVLLGPDASGGEDHTHRADVVRQVLAIHPEVRATARDAEAAAREVDAAGGLAPLALRTGVAPLSLMERPGIEVEAGWALPTWGMRRLAREVAGASAEMAGAAGEMTRVELAARASIAVDDLLVARARLGVLDHHLTVLREAEGTLQRRVGSGLQSPDAVIMAKMAVIDAEELRLRAERAAREARAEFTALVGDAIDPDRVVAERVPAEGARATPPSVGMAEAEVRMNAGMATMAGREGLPMIEPMVSWSSMWEDPMHRVMVGVAMEVPLDHGAVRAAKESAGLREAAAAARVDAAKVASGEAAERARAMIDEATAMATLMTEQMMPVAVERARLARIAWESDRGSLADWLRAEREVAETELRAVEARAEADRAQAMLAMAEGRLAGLEDE